jgi:hypothetical protein
MSATCPLHAKRHSADIAERNSGSGAIGIDFLDFYLSDVETLLKVAFKFVPSACTVAMIATAMPAAINPYSIAVAPDRSFKNQTMCCDTISLLASVQCHPAT